MLDPIVKGCTWQARLYIDPGAGRTAQEVIDELTGASVVVRLIDQAGVVRATSAGSSIISATDREVEALFSAAETSALTPGIGFVLDVRITTTGGEVRPIQVREKLEVRPYTTAVGR